ncbi:hypothetical protein H632_c2282p0 [Helicosporidium sp. ATCC 50920]|nr:hypothetical protein H632_c2282p0 [Helicosporidium sp. ATCC 50920]|eukprot:KDD73334.1 hypothetical protein H632_c2282p0 [Helicosporidium sp. ATCC 50920]
MGLHPHAAQPHQLLHPPHPLHDSPWGGLFAGGGEETPLSDATGLPQHRGSGMPLGEGAHRPSGNEHAGHSLAGNHSLGGGHSSHPSSWSLSPHPTPGSHDLGDPGLVARTHGDLLNSSSGSCAANTPSHASYQLFHLANELARGAHPGEGDGQQSPCSFALFGSQGAAQHPGAHVHAAAALLDGLGGLAEGYSPMRGGGGAEPGEQGAASASGAGAHAELFGDQTPRSQAAELGTLPQTPTEELFSTDAAEGGAEGAEHALLGHQGFKLEEAGLVMR